MSLGASRLTKNSAIYKKEQLVFRVNDNTGALAPLCEFAKKTFTWLCAVYVLVTSHYTDYCLISFTL